MSGLAAVLAGRHEAGVFRWHGAFSEQDVRHTVEHVGWQFAYLDGWTLEDKDAFLAAVSAAFGFSASNFDALLDSLRDIGGYPDDPDHEAGTVLLWDGWGPFAYADEKAFSVALSVLTQRADESEAGRFAVLLRGEGPDLADVPSLD